MKPNGAAWIIPALLGGVLLTGAVQAQVAWVKSFAAAKQEGAQSGKPVLVDFYATWCGPCKLMEKETFSDSSVRALMKRAVCVRVDIDQNPALAEKYGVESIPRVLLLPAESEQPVMDLHGFRPPDDFAANLRQALGLKPREVVLPVDETPELTKVRQSLQDKQYAALKGSDPKAASTGLTALVASLGTLKEAQLAPAIGLLRNAGDDAVPALLRGMRHRLLAVRAASYRSLQTLMREQRITNDLTYDPWAPAANRDAQVARWSAWWTRRGKSSTQSHRLHDGLSYVAPLGLR